jgi:hypothetical protein
MKLLPGGEAASTLLDVPPAAAVREPVRQRVRVVKLVRRRRTHSRRRFLPLGAAGEGWLVALWLLSSASLLWHLPGWHALAATGLAALILCSPRPRAGSRR